MTHLLAGCLPPVYQIVCSAGGNPVVVQRPGCHTDLCGVAGTLLCIRAIILVEIILTSTRKNVKRGEISKDIKVPGHAIIQVCN
jgi:hypothetical protein